MKKTDEKYVHGHNLIEYVKKHTKAAAVISVLDEYECFRDSVDPLEICTNDDIKQLVQALNAYRSKAVPVFSSMKNAGQKALGYTIMEEFFYILFSKMPQVKNMEESNLFVGKGNSYVSLSFTPESYKSLFAHPHPYLHTKDQDFMLGANISMCIEGASIRSELNTVIPAVAIECKTYLERNMLDSCAATAFRLKRAMPYCIYMVAAECLKMSNSFPELTDIDEIYILCKAKNTERQRRLNKENFVLDIDAELIIDMYDRVDRHLRAMWWKPQDALINGKIINRP